MAEEIEPVTRPKFVLLTSGGIDGRRVATLMHRRGIPFELVLIAHPRRKRRGKSTLKFIPTWFRDQLAGINILRRIYHRELPPYPIDGRYCGRTNSDGLIRHLSKTSPDYIIMMGGGILSNKTIQTAKKGVLNVHPALLPWVRGVDVLLHSVVKKVPLGVTGHFIDAGIDTGEIIARYKLPVVPGDRLGQIKKKSRILCCAVMVDLVNQLNDGKILHGHAQMKQFDLCRTMKPSDQQSAVEMINDGEAERLFKREFGDTNGVINDGTKLIEEYSTWWGDKEPF